MSSIEMGDVNDALVGTSVHTDAKEFFALMDSMEADCKLVEDKGRVCVAFLVNNQIAGAFTRGRYMLHTRFK